MRYKCQFPGCTYETNQKSQIHNHHIVPKENNGTNKKYNLINLCPNHHSKIYIENSKHGIHSIKGDDSIILLGWKYSTSGNLLEYKDLNGNIFYK